LRGYSVVSGCNVCILAPFILEQAAYTTKIINVPSTSSVADVDFNVGFTHNLSDVEMEIVSPQEYNGKVV
jgi:hypothetical protein